MKAEYINPFLEATSSVLSMMCGTQPTFGKLFIKDSPYSSSSVVVIIGVTGKMKGQVIFSFEDQTALNIASLMMGGMNVTTLDELARSAISELGNMVMGNASTNFANKGLFVEITPPTLLRGDNLMVSNKVKTLCIPIEVGNYGSMEIGIAAEEA